MTSHGRQIGLGGEEDAEGVFELRLIGRELLGNAGLRGAVAEQKDLQALLAGGGLAEGEGLAADELIGGDGRADALLDVLDEQLGAALVADEGPALRVIHRVGHVAHEHDVLAVLRHLAEAEGPAGDAHVHVDAHEDDVLDAAGFEQVPNLDAGIADGVLLLVDAQHVDLLRPRGARIEALRLEFLRPGGVFGGIIVFAAVGSDRWDRPQLPRPGSVCTTRRSCPASGRPAARTSRARAPECLRRASCNCSAHG